MLVLLSLLVAIGFAQLDCTVQPGNPSQRRRQCKDKKGCKWVSEFTDDNGDVVPGSCKESSTCSVLSHNKCKKRNDCYINWAVEPKVCVEYNKDQTYPCAQLSGKKNMAKCEAQALCMKGGGDRANKRCLDIPADLQTRPCSDFSAKHNKYLCIANSKCTWDGRGKDRSKSCILKRRPAEKACNTVNNQDECNNQPNGCVWRQNQCRDITCGSIDDRAKCNKSDLGCTWFSGIHATDYEPGKKRKDQKNNLKDTLGARDGTCKEGVKACSDIAREDSCELALQNHGISGCSWNKEAQEMGRPRCQNRKPCKSFTANGQTACENARNMDNDNCVWQKSGDSMRCMEFDCTSARVRNDKNGCNTTGCFWHRNKDKRNPGQLGYCDVLDFTKGRRM